jgi:hypothetical protein
MTEIMIREAVSSKACKMPEGEPFFVFLRGFLVCLRFRVLVPVFGGEPFGGAFGETFFLLVPGIMLLYRVNRLRNIDRRLIYIAS